MIWECFIFWHDEQESQGRLELALSQSNILAKWVAILVLPTFERPWSMYVWASFFDLMLLDRKFKA